jgi:predicted ribosome quality control (RQC) complex YloA/Tae2 family protein
LHNNYYFLKQLSAQLNQQLIGFRVVSCFSQNKEELILECNNSKQSIFIKASLQPTFCCLSFPTEFNRAKKNSADLFPDIILKKILSIKQYENERSFSLQLEEGITLLFKMHGSQSNIVLFYNSSARSIFRNQFKKDLTISLDELDKTIDWSIAYFQTQLHDLQKAYSTFGKPITRHLEAMFKTLTTNEEKWFRFQETKKQLENPRFYIIKSETNFMLSLIPMGEAVAEYADPILALNEFFHKQAITLSFQSEKTKVLKELNDQLKGRINYLEKTEQKVNELVNDLHYQLWADLIMANMHRLKLGMETIELTNFYTGQLEKIKLKKELNAQRNAEVFYRKSKNQQIEVNKLNASIQAKKREIEKLHETIDALNKSETIKTVRLHGSEKPTNTKEIKSKTLPYHAFEFKGFKIWVGKNAEANDELTLKHSHKEDLWLHAKDVAGSHVIIKHQSGKKIPKEVIERAAELAAYNSKRKTDSLCPVAFTPKKFVRKRKGDPAGMVVVEKEDTILVRPAL